MLRWLNDFETADEELEKREECYKLLLDAGSDISSIRLQAYRDIDVFWVSAFSEELMYGTSVRLIPLLPSIFKAAYHI